MSSDTAIRAVTEQLVARLAGISGVTMSSGPLDKLPMAAKGLNVFLYNVAINATWRNMDPPRKSRPGEGARPLLTLSLHYLLTAHSSNQDLDAHAALGEAMLALHDTPFLVSPTLDPQYELIRITQTPMSVDEMSKLWTMFHAPYRASAAYEVSAILIESRRPTPAPLPVLRRGPEDRGPTAISAAPPELTEVRLPRGQAAIELGQTMMLIGHNLDAGVIGAIFRFERLGLPDIPVPIAGGNAAELSVTLPDLTTDPDGIHKWAPGTSAASLVAQNPDVVRPWTTNEIPFGLAPVIVLQQQQVAQGADLTIECRPRMRPGQQALLLLGSVQLAPKSIDLSQPALNPDGSLPASEAPKLLVPTKLTFTIPPTTPKADYVVRLRVEGSDSIPVRSVKRDPNDPNSPDILDFDPAYKVKIT